MANLRQITLHFDTHDAVIDLDHIIKVDVERDILGDTKTREIKFGPPIVTIVVEAENMTAYARPVDRTLPGTKSLPQSPDKPRKLLRRKNL